MQAALQRGWALGLGCLWAWFCAVGPALAQAGPPPAAAARDRADIQARAAAVARTVFGILSYVRWPSDPVEIRVCVVGPTEYADDLIATPAVSQPSGRRLTLRRYDLSAVDGQCEAVYVGVLADAAWRDLYRRVAGQPIVTIGERRDQCQSGGMFCLDADAGAEVPFEANLDSIARSGVRVHPSVLQLARRRGAR